LWWLGPSRGLLGVLVVTGCGSLAAAGRLFPGQGPLGERVELPQAWSQLSASGVAVWLGVVAASYLIAVNGVARDRRGEPWSLAWLCRWWAAKADAASRRSRDQRGAVRFRSAASAQFWYEWRARGRSVPLVTAGMLVALWLSLRLLAVPPPDVSIVMESFTALFLVASPLVGVFLGSRRKGFDLESFTATRPLADRRLAAAVLRNAAASVGSAAVIWLAGSAAAMAVWVPAEWQPLRSLSNVSIAELFEELVWPISLLSLACWTLVGLGASLALCRRWFVCCTGLGLVVLLLSFASIADALPRFVAELLIVLVAAACLGCTVTAFVAARHLGLLSPWAACACLAGYVVLLVYLYGACPAVDESGLTHALRIGFAAAPFAPFAAAPLALSWNRHR
jgi:hypothetical protein